MNVVLVGRTIFACALSVAMLVSVAPGNPAERPGKAQKLHDCCAKDESSQPTQKKECNGGPCAMQCCRLIPAPAENIPQLTGRIAIIETVVNAPAVLHSLAEPQAIFHPPRA